MQFMLYKPAYTVYTSEYTRKALPVSTSNAFCNENGGEKGMAYRRLLFLYKDNMIDVQQGFNIQLQPVLDNQRNP